MTDTMAAARDRACLALRRRGATAVVVLTLDDAGTLRLAASHDENLDGSTIYQMMTYFRCYTNQLTGYAGGGVSITLGDFQAQDNLLTEAAVDAILADFVAANKTTGTRVLNIGGTGNATPSATGLTDKATLVSRGWTVTTN